MDRLKALHERLPKDDPVARRDALLNLHRYEREKREWAKRNPAATPVEYQDAMKRIAEECGV